MSIFHRLEVVGRGSETQLQVGEVIFATFSALHVNITWDLNMKYQLL